jgi:hypothetical protein
MVNVPISEWLQQAQWVVRATVEETTKSTVAVLPSSSNTVALRVDEILYGPEAFADHKNRVVTLYSSQPTGLVKGYRAVFFTRSWVYGDNLAVVEVGRVEEDPTRNIRNEIQSAHSALADQKLLERIRRAELVIVGKVVKTQPAHETQRRQVETEHDPEWWMASVEVVSTVMGKVSEHVISVLFPSSRDEMWIDSPKLAPGQTWILILQRNQVEKGWPVLRLPGLTALDPLDVQPPDQLDRIRELIRR